MIRMLRNGKLTVENWVRVKHQARMTKILLPPIESGAIAFNGHDGRKTSAENNQESSRRPLRHACQYGLPSLINLGTSLRHWSRERAIFGGLFGDCTAGLFLAASQARDGSLLRCYLHAVCSQRVLGHGSHVCDILPMLLKLRRRETWMD